MILYKVEWESPRSVLNDAVWQRFHMIFRHEENQQKAVELLSDSPYARNVRTGVVEVNG